MQELISLFLHGGFGHSSYVGHRDGGGKKKNLFGPMLRAIFCSILQSTLEASICKLT